MPQKMKIQELMAHLERLAPFAVAASWDNSGLLIGSPQDEVSKVLITLDTTLRVVEYAQENKFDLIVSHHPLFRDAFKTINDPLILKLIRNGIALIASHTNLDFAAYGVNRALADRLELKETQFLAELPEINRYHIAVYTPAEDTGQVSEAVFAAGAGIIGNYSHCMNRYQVEGQFKPLAGSNPAIGSHNALKTVPEIKQEFFADGCHLEKVIAAMIAAHPYETPAYSIYKVEQTSPNYGLGLTGYLPKPMSVRDVALMVKARLEAPFVTLWSGAQGDDWQVTKIAVCGGSGSDLISIAEKKAELFVTADLKYHSIIGCKLPLIDAGHYFTESPVLPVLQKHLTPLGLETEIYKKSEAEIYKLKVL